MARKITEEAVSAFLSGETFGKGNTQVRHDGSRWLLVLHGNPIARYGADGRVEVCDGGWQTHTTKERLNGIPGVSVHQSNSQWYLNGIEWDGEWTPAGLDEEGYKAWRVEQALTAEPPAVAI